MDHESRERGKGAIERDSNSPPRSDEAIGSTRIHWIARTSVVSLGKWSCSSRRSRSPEEQVQPWYSIGFVHSGSYCLRDSRGRSLIDPTRVDFLSPALPYTTTHPVDSCDAGAFLVLEPDFLEDLLSEYGSGAFGASDPRFAVQSTPIDGPSYLTHWKLLARASWKSPSDRLAWEESAINLVDDVLSRSVAARRTRIPRRRAVEARRSSAVDAATNFLARNFTGRPRLSEIARESGVSAYHLCRIFREITGVTIHRYLSRLRLRHALIQLDRRERDLSALAHDLGFSHHSHFSEEFRLEYGLPPTAVLRALRGN